MNIDKKINKTLKFLKKNSKLYPNNEIDKSFIKVFLLYTQIKYDLNLGINAPKDLNVKLYDCFKYIYGNKSIDELKEEVFEDNDILLEIFTRNKKFDSNEILKKIVDKIYSINYVNTHIEILDYLGNTSQTMEIINYTYALIWLKELYPNLKISNRFIKILTKHLIDIAENKKEELRYSNTEATLLLFLLNRIIYFPNIHEWIQNLLNLQKGDGRWSNGYNSYFIDDTQLYDSYHTILALNVMLEYKTLIYYLEEKNNEEEIPEDIEHVEEKPLPKIKFDENEIPNIIEGFENPAKSLFELEKVMKINDKYTIHYNIYNVSFLLSIIFIFYYLNRSPIQ